MKLNRLKSVINQLLRESLGGSQGYMIDPFYHYTPEREITIDLIKGTFSPDLEGDDIERYYKSIIEWFHEVLPKEGIPIDVIDSAILKINPEGKECIIEAQGRKFTASLKFKKK
ncbi:MAG: hypothetical protein ACFE9P_14925 [Candidatus Hermodarchaeota archaeon]